MRLHRLDLVRYGHFTDYTLDFGKAEPGRPDLHVIFGPNEAGKTTAFEGYLDFLYGIPMRSPYNFLHDYDNMRLSGALDIDGETVEFTRIKKTRNDLLDAHGDPANPAVLLHALGGISRDQYRSMFSLDDETIEAGGDDILASQGSLGELLFSAAAGLSDLGSVLDRARADIDAFHKPRAHKTVLGVAKKDLGQLHKQIRDIDMNASAFHSLRKAEDGARAKHDAARSERDRLLAEKARLDAMLECLPLLPDMDAIRAQLSALAEYPEIPEDWDEKVRALHMRQVRIGTENSSAAETGAKLAEKRDAIRRDPPILSIRAEIEVLMDTPRSRAQTAGEDLPRRREELADLQADISGVLGQFGFAGAETAIISEPQLLRLETAADASADKAAALATARDEQRRAEQKWTALAQEGAAPDPGGLPDDDLAALLSRLDPDGLASRLELARAEVQTAEQAATRARSDLAPWTGEMAPLPAAGLTQDQARRLAEHWGALAENAAQARKNLDDASLRLDQIAGRLALLEHDDSLFTDDDARAARSARDAAWARHLADMTPQTGETFHQTMVQSDTVQEARLGMAERIAQLRDMQLNKAETEATVDHFRRALRDGETEIVAARETLAGHFAALGLPGGFDVRDLAGWLRALEKAQQAQADLDRKTAALQPLARQASEAEAALRKALGAETGGGGLRDLARLARDRVSDLERAKARQQAISRAAEDLGQRQRITERLQQDADRAAEAWAQQAAGLPASLRCVADFRAALSTLRKLNGWLTECGKLARRIEAMETDQSAFADQVRALAGAAGEDILAAPPVLAERLQDRLSRAQNAEQLFADLTGQIEDQAEIRDNTGRELAAIGQTLRQMADRYPPALGVETLDDLQAAVAGSRKTARLRAELGKLERLVIKRLGAASLAEAMQTLSGHDQPGIEARLDAVRDDLGRAEEDLTGAIGDLRAARDSLGSVGGDDAAARLEERRQTILLSIADAARQSLRLRLGVMAAEQALARYRDAHRSRMLSESAAAFRRLTAGRYSDLQTQSDGHKEILLALRDSDKRSIAAADMSKGTRFQLYLALRLAGYRQFAAGGTTLPFVADDIMETFDNRRTSAALDLLREIALQGQALYFTHHEHVVDLAKATLGDRVSIHHLGRAGQA